MVLPRLDKIKGIALDLFFPQRCIGCGNEGELICAVCRGKLPLLLPPLCPRCGRHQPAGDICPDCTNWQAQIDGIRSPFSFDGVIRLAIHQFKYRNLRALAAPLSRLLQEYLAAYPIPADVLVPVPLHPNRLRERGYNQSSLLAQKLGELTGLPVSDGCLIRTRYAIPQVKTVSVAERRRNVAGAFTCRDTQLRNSKVLLIDDVSTAGATLNACAQALKSSGAVSAWGLVLAREL